MATSPLKFPLDLEKIRTVKLLPSVTVRILAAHLHQDLDPQVRAIPTHAWIFAAFRKELRFFQMPRKIIRDHKFAFYDTLGSGMCA